MKYGFDFCWVEKKLRFVVWFKVNSNLIFKIEIVPPFKYQPMLFVLWTTLFFLLYTHHSNIIIMQYYPNALWLSSFSQISHWISLQFTLLSLFCWYFFIPPHQIWIFVRCLIYDLSISFMILSKTIFFGMHSPFKSK